MRRIVYQGLFVWICLLVLLFELSTAQRSLAHRRPRGLSLLGLPADPSAHFQQRVRERRVSIDKVQAIYRFLVVGISSVCCQARDFQGRIASFYNIDSSRVFVENFTAAPSCSSTVSFADDEDGPSSTLGYLSAFYLSQLFGIIPQNVTNQVLGFQSITAWSPTVPPPTWEPMPPPPVPRQTNPSSNLFSATFNSERDCTAFSQSLTSYVDLNANQIYFVSQTCYETGSDPEGNTGYITTFRFLTPPTSTTWDVPALPLRRDIEAAIGLLPAALGARMWKIQKLFLEVNGSATHPISISFTSSARDGNLPPRYNVISQTDLSPADFKQQLESAVAQAGDNRTRVQLLWRSPNGIVYRFNDSRTENLFLDCVAPVIPPSIQSTPVSIVWICLGVCGVAVPLVLFIASRRPKDAIDPIAAFNPKNSESSKDFQQSLQVFAPAARSEAEHLRLQQQRVPTYHEPTRPLRDEEEESEQKLISNEAAEQNPYDLVN